MAHLETLIEKATQGELLLLVGNDLPKAVTGIPSGRELAHGLSEMWGKTAEPSLAAMANKLNRRQYIPFVLEQVNSADQGDPSDFHRAVASLPIPYLMTAGYDGRLSQALEDAGKQFNRLVVERDLDKRVFNRTDLIKVVGDIKQPGTLVISGNDYDTLLTRPDQKKVFNSKVNDWLMNKTVLMVGCDPASSPDEESDFFWLYRHVLRLRSAFVEGGFIVWQNPTDIDFWSRPDPRTMQVPNVTIIDADPVSFLDQLGAGLVGKAISIPVDSELEALKRLGRVLVGSASTAEVREQGARVSSEQRVRLIRASLRLKLGGEEGEETLLARLDMACFPDFMSFPPDEFRDTGLTIEDLEEWAEDSSIRRTKRQSFDKSVVEESGIAFLDMIMPENSRPRQSFGQALFLDQTFTDQFVIVLELDDEKGRLSRIPWELLHAGKIDGQGLVNGRGFLGRNFPVYRRLPGATRAERVEARIRRILVIAADPTDKLTVELKKEIGWLREMFPHGVHVDIFGPDDPVISQPDKIKELLRDGDYQAFHFTGHGLFNDLEPEKSKLLLGRPEDQETFQLTAGELGEIALHSPLTFVCLSACQVGESAEGVDEARPWEELGIADALINKGVPAVLGMRWNVGVDSALKMVKRFYTELLKGKSLEQSLLLARGDVDIDQPDWANPVLIKRHGVLDRGIDGNWVNDE